MIRKELVIGIIILFVGANVVTITSGDTSDPFKYEQSWEYDFNVASQEGITSNDNGIFFITSWRKLFVAELDEINNKFTQTNINGISEITLTIDDHLGDPFCDDIYLFVPRSNYNPIYKWIPDKAYCHVFYLSNLTEIKRFDLKKNGEYITGCSSGAYYNGYYYFSTYFEDPSRVYKFSFDPDPDIGFGYIEDYSLGKSDVQGIEFMGDMCYFIRGHDGEDPYVYWINANTWDTNNIYKQDLVDLTGNTNGPYEGITFDTSDGSKCIAYFGFGYTNPGYWGPEIFEAFEFIENPPPTVSAFSVDPDSITLGDSFTISYTVSDEGGSGLKQVELWRKGTGDWEQIEVTSLEGMGNGPYSGSFYDTPTAVGTYWYGIHVVNNAGSWASEDSPINVEVTLEEYPHDDSGEDSTDNGFSIPGFEVLFVILAVALVLYWKRKRRLGN